MAAVLVTGACGDDEADSGATLAPSIDADGRPDCARGAPCEVTREQFGVEWPYTLDGGVLTCVTVADAPEGDLLDSTQALLLEADGTTYALNFPAERVADDNGWRSGEESATGDPEAGTFAMPFLLWGLRICG
jgi:hypothetical protein